MSVATGDTGTPAVFSHQYIAVKLAANTNSNSKKCDAFDLIRFGRCLFPETVSCVGSPPAGWSASRPTAAGYDEIKE